MKIKLSQLLYYSTLSFMAVWLIAIAFFFYISIKLASSESYGNFMGNTLLVGILAFGLMIASAVFRSIISKKHNKKVITSKEKVSKREDSKLVSFIVIGLFIVLVSIAFLSYRESNLIASQKKSNQDLLKGSFQTPTATSVPIGVKTNVPDPLITCSIHVSCGGGSKQLKKSVCDSMNCCLIDKRCGGPKFITIAECNNSYCCTFSDGTGKLLASKSACDNYFSNNNLGNTYTVPNYPPCTIYYPALGRSETYNYTSPEQCQQWKDSVSATTTKVYTPLYTIAPLATIAPQPTIDQDLCSQSASMANEYLADFRANKMDDYASSAEAMIAYLSEKQQLQNQINSYGCTITLN